VGWAAINTRTPGSDILATVPDGFVVRAQREPTTVVAMTQPRPPVHPVVARVQADFQTDLVAEVSAAIAADQIVVVGVSGLAPGKKARKLLDAKGAKYRYLEYGSYFKGWRRRLALKIWVGWPTFPLVFIKGTFVGGASDLKALIDSGEFDTLTK